MWLWHKKRTKSQKSVDKSDKVIYNSGIDNKTQDNTQTGGKHDNKRRFSK